MLAALTASVAVRAVSDRSESSFRRNAETLAVGNAVAAAESLKEARSMLDLRLTAASAAASRGLTLFVLDRSGRQIASGGVGQRPLGTIPHSDDALKAVRAGKRYIFADSASGDIVVALPVRGKHGRSIVTYVRRPELATQLGVVHNAVFRSAAWATALGAGAGLLIATLIALRLQRIAAAAKRIAGGDFTRPVSRGFPDEVGGLAGSLDSMRLRLRQLFEALEEQRDRLESLLDRLHEGVLLIGRDLNVQFANDRARELLDVPSLEGKTFPNSTSAGPGLRDFVAGALDQPHVQQQRLELANGRVLQVAALPPSASSEALILVIADETIRERSERAQREFATSAAHQLRTPVASIVSSVEMLQTGAKDDPAARDAFLSAIEEQADRLTRLTRALLTLARAEAQQEAPRPGRAAVESLLQRVVRAVPVRDDVTVSVNAEPIDAWVDADLLEQALVSVLENAAKHSRAGTIELAASAADDRVVITVADSGTGMSPDERAHAFERFYKGDGEDGFGLGLAIARQAVVASGGAIEIESEPNVGTTVWVEVPAYAEARSA